MDGLDVKLIDALHLARKERDAAGMSERGRVLSIVVTKLEEAVLWLNAGEGLA